MIHRILAALLICITSANSLAQKVEITNNQPFDVRMPWKLHDGRTVMIDVAALGKQSIDTPPAPAASAAKVTLEPVDNGVHLKRGQQDLGTLAWDLVLEKLQADPSDLVTKRPFHKTFKPLAMKFAKAGGGGLFESWSAEATKDGLKLHVDIDAYPAGFVDIRGTFTNESAPTTKVYAAVVTRWQQPKATSRSVDYNNDIRPLADGSSTPFRAGGGEPSTRHLMIQRGVDWMNVAFKDASVAWLNDFSPSFTVHHDKRGKNPPKWTGANIAQLGQEALAVGDALYSITEIARPNIKMYASRLDSNVLPEKDEPLVFTSRLMMSDDRIADGRVDQMFVAYTGFNRETKHGDVTELALGVPFTKFGTAYFPYSTLGENFEKFHLPGQSSDTYWPLSADTVTNYKLFADDIRRDLRIAKAMGFETIRLHHLELIASLPKQAQDEYLDFLFAELKPLGLTALLDVKLPAQRIVELVQKYKSQLEGVEIDNEVLIFGINDADVPLWKDIYPKIKQGAPDLPVWFTGHTNTGAFERLRKLDVPFDRVGAHAYMDSIEAIPSARDYALAVANYAAKVGKEPVITEWNWRFLTRMTPEARAEVYPPIYENVLKTRCMPTLYQFQLQESLAMASHTLRGIRHYELLNLSRRPKPDAFEFMKLIDRYSSPAAANHQLAVDHPVVELKDRKGEAVFHFTNTSEKPLTLSYREEANPDVIVPDAKFDATLQPGEPGEYLMSVALKDTAKPGFYHVFVRFDGPDGFVRYSWGEARNPGPVQIDKDKGVHPEVVYGPGALDFDFNRDVAVVYGDGREKESRWDVESAWLIAQTLESASGRPVRMFQLKDLPADLRESGNLILVGMPDQHEMIKQSFPSGAPKGSWVQAQKNHLIVGGDDEAKLNLAAIDLVLRYWVHAKDSGAARVPLTDKPIEKGADPGALP